MGNFAIPPNLRGEHHVHPPTAPLVVQYSTHRRELVDLDPPMRTNTFARLQRAALLMLFVAVGSFSWLTLVGTGWLDETHVRDDPLTVSPGGDSLAIELLQVEGNPSALVIHVINMGSREIAIDSNCEAFFKWSVTASAEDKRERMGFDPISAVEGRMSLVRPGAEIRRELSLTGGIAGSTLGHAWVKDPQFGAIHRPAFVKNVVAVSDFSRGGFTVRAHYDMRAGSDDESEMGAWIKRMKERGMAIPCCRASSNAIFVQR